MKSNQVLWKALSILIIGMMVVSCSPPAPTTAPTQEAVATKASPATQAPEATEVSTLTVKPAIPYPDPPKLDVGGAAVNRLPIDQIVTYKALPEYNQPDWMDKLVADGELPPVEERLPKEPQVDRDLPFRQLKVGTQREA